MRQYINRHSIYRYNNNVPSLGIRVCMRLVQTYKVLVEVSLRFAVGDACHRLIVVELVTQLAEISRHRDHMIHTYTSVRHSCCWLRYLQH